MRLLYFIALLWSSLAFGQLSDSHWLPPVHANDVISFPQYIYLSTPETTPFEVTVTNGNGVPIAGSPFTISQANPVETFIGAQNGTDMFISETFLNTVRGDDGLILTGPNEFYVTFKMTHSSHAELLVSKGTDALGTDFRVGVLPQNSVSSFRNFTCGFMATEDNTTVVVSDYDTNIQFLGASGPTPETQTFVLNAGESVVLAGNNNNAPAANLLGFVGARIESDQPIAVNAGNILGNLSPGGSDMYLDQTVPVDLIGTEYIVMRGDGEDAPTNDNGIEAENPFVIATEPNTDIFINGSTTPFATLVDPGDFVLIPDTFYEGAGQNQNMYITTSSPAYVYQSLDAVNSVLDITSGLSFISPLSCLSPTIFDVIPQVDIIIPLGQTVSGVPAQSFTTTLTVLTTVDAVLTINDGAIATGTAQGVVGNPNWVSYKIPNVTGDISLESTGPMTAGVYGSGLTTNMTATVAGFFGYYTGFGTITADPVSVCSSETTNLLDAIVEDIPSDGVWSPALASGTDLFDASIDAAGVYTYSVTQTCGAIEVDVTVEIIPTPDINSLTNNGPICPNEDAIFTLTGTPDAVLSFNINGGATQTLVLDATGTATVTIPAVTQDQTILLEQIEDLVVGCSRDLDNTETIVVNALGEVTSFTSDSPICEGDDAIFTVIGSINGVVEYTINGGDLLTVTLDDTGLGIITVPQTLPGNVTVTLVGITNTLCTTAATLALTESVEVIALTVVTFDPFEDVCLNSLETDLPTVSLEGVIGTWSPPQINTSALGISSHTFTPDSNEFCATGVDIDINIISCFIQRGISPNNDGLNDSFDLSGFDVTELQIFSRLGTEVFSMTNYVDQWIGQTNGGDELPTGTYYYVIDFEDMESRTGWIYIQREE